MFSGVKLTITVAEDGTVTVEQTDAALETNAGAVVVEAGAGSVDDGVIKGTMDYLVKGVEEV